MVSTICDRLNLDIKAGLGWRLCQVNVEEDESQAGLYYLLADDVVEANTLAQALNVLAATCQMKFITRRPQPSKFSSTDGADNKA